MTLLFFLVAQACPPTSSELRRAQVAYDDAEVDVSAKIVSAAVGQLGCQSSVVLRQTLLDLYRLQALVSLARSKDGEAVEAIIRAVTVDPLSTPPTSVGPEIASLHRSWAGRLSDKRATVSVLGGGVVYVDGEPLHHGQQMTVVRGQHLIQIDGQGGFTSVVDAWENDRSVLTGLPSPEAPLQPLLPPGKGPPKMISRRVRPAVLWIAGLGLAGAGAGVATVAGLQERAFHARRYDTYEEVDADVVRIRALYIVGYSVLAAGGLVTATVAIGLPQKRR